MGDDYKPRARDDDEVSLISMRELAPSPIDDEYEYGYEKTTPPPPLQQPKSSALHRHSPHTDGLALWRNLPPPRFPFPASLALHKTDGGASGTVTRAQRYSSYAFLVFLGVHGATAAATPLVLGVDAGNASLLLARTYFYQSSSLAEAVLVPGALGLHVAAGLALRWYRVRRQRARYGGSGGRIPRAVSLWRWRNLSAVSRTGWLAVPLVAAHATVTRLVPLCVDGDSALVSLDYLAYGFWRPVVWLGSGSFSRRATPWLGAAAYAAFVGLVSYHTAHGLVGYIVGNRSPPDGGDDDSARRTRRIANAAAAGTTAVWLAGLARVVVGAGKAGGYLGRHYERLYYSIIFL